MPLNPKLRPALFMLMVFGIMIPYLGFAMYFSTKYPSGQWPTWLTDTLVIWFLANFVLIATLSRKVFRGRAVNPEKARTAAATSLRTSIRLTIFWSLLFLYGVKETLQGKLPVKRAVPAGVFLLIFIGIFGWGIYQSKRRKA